MKKTKYFVLFLIGMAMWLSAVYFTTIHTVLHLLPLSMLGGYMSGLYFYKFIKYKP